MAAEADPRWGLAARGGTVEAGSPAFEFPLRQRAEIWADEVSHLYAQGLASQWDPATAVDWDDPFELEDEIEDAVVQIMTYLVENETAALVLPAWAPRSGSSVASGPGAAPHRLLRRGLTQEDVARAVDRLSQCVADEAPPPRPRKETGGPFGERAPAP